MTRSGETYVRFSHTIVPHKHHPMCRRTPASQRPRQLLKAVLHHTQPAEQREEHLGEFYKNWVLQEAPRQEEYDCEWRRRSMQEIRLAARVSYQKLKARFTT